MSYTPAGVLEGLTTGEYPKAGSYLNLYKKVYPLQ